MTDPGIGMLLSPDFDRRLVKRSAFRNGLLVRAHYWVDMNLVYVRIPKCGNQSIRGAIPGGKSLILDPLSIDKDSTRPLIFSFVRNPWDRLVSTWADKIRPVAITDAFFENGVSRALKQSNLPVYPNMPFAEFVKMACDFDDTETENHLRSQSFFIVRGEAPFPHFVGRFEDFSSSWVQLMQLMGLNFRLPHVNKSVHSDYSSYYDDGLVELVANRYKNDITLFNYRFDAQY